MTSLFRTLFFWTLAIAVAVIAVANRNMVNWLSRRVQNYQSHRSVAYCGWIWTWIRAWIDRWTVDANALID